MSDLGKLPRNGVLSSLNRITAGGWVITFSTQLLPQSAFEVWHGSLTGPGGYALLYLDTALYGVLQNGRINEYAPTIPMYVSPGQEISIHFSIATGTAPTATLYFRTPEVGRI